MSATSGKELFVQTGNTQLELVYVGSKVASFSKVVVYISMHHFLLFFLNNSCPIRFMGISFLVNTILIQKNIIFKARRGDGWCQFCSGGLDSLSIIVSLSQHVKHDGKWTKWNPIWQPESAGFWWMCNTGHLFHSNITTIADAVCTASCKAPGIWFCFCMGNQWDSHLFLAVAWCYYYKSHDLKELLYVLL